MNWYRRMFPMRATLYFLPFLLALFAFALSSPPDWLRADEGGPAGGAVVRVPVAQTVAVGSDVVVDVSVENVTSPDGLGAYEFAIVYDPSVLTFEDVADGPFLSSTGRTIFCPDPVFDRNGDGVPDPGFVRWGCGTLGAQLAGPTGGGVLASLTFSTSCDGTSNLDFDLVALSDLLGDPLGASSQNGSVTVDGGSDCPPPVTPPPPPPTPTRNRGDVNCDGSVTAVDAVLILQLDARMLIFLPCLSNADVNGDGVADAIDALLVLQNVAGLISLS